MPRRPSSAARCRIFPPEPGYSSGDGAIPELVLAAAPECRGQGVGGALPAALMEAACAAGFGAVGLSVEPTNHAVRLYERHGFMKAGESGGSWTMYDV
jgi:ribosomal protein S18 acetylase RimI-like enzyme